VPLFGLQLTPWLCFSSLFGGSAATKVGAVVAGQTSVKAPEKEAFEKHLPEDCYIISLHSLHGPTVSPEGQPLVRTALSRPLISSVCDIRADGSHDCYSLQVVIQHRAPDEKLRMVERIFASFKSHYVYMTYAEHDLVTANTQAATHAAFLS
jgi:prephenate dehydrogenase (NADP+)